MFGEKGTFSVDTRKHHWFLRVLTAHNMGSAPTRVLGKHPAIRAEDPKV